MEFVAYQGWRNCLRLANDVCELIIPGEIGPRIIHFGLLGGDNEFMIDPATAGQSGGEDYHLYGGHRLWRAPESLAQTYHPDNEAVQFTEHASFTRVTGPIEPGTSLQKELDIRLSPDSPCVEIIHRLINHGHTTIECAPWAISMMAPGGTCILPLPPRGLHDDNLLPASSLALWAYTDMADPRFHWGSQHILIRQESLAETPQKIGATVPSGWIAYARAGNLFVSRFTPDPQALYPDRDSQVEVYTDSAVLEIETLAPLTTLLPGASVELPLTWELFTGVEHPTSDTEVEKSILPLLANSR